MSRKHGDTATDLHTAGSSCLRPVSADCISMTGMWPVGHPQDCGSVPCTPKMTDSTGWSTVSPKIVTGVQLRQARPAGTQACEKDAG